MYNSDVLAALSLPVPGLSREQLLQELRERKRAETDPHSGKIFAYVYTTEDERFQTVQRAFDMFEFGMDEEEGKEGEGEGEGEGGEEGEEKGRHTILRIFWYSGNVIKEYPIYYHSELKSQTMHPASCALL